MMDFESLVDVNVSSLKSLLIHSASEIVSTSKLALLNKIIEKKTSLFLPWNKSNTSLPSNGCIHEHTIKDRKHLQKIVLQIPKCRRE